MHTFDIGAILGFIVMTRTVFHSRPNQKVTLLLSLGYESSLLSFSTSFFIEHKKRNGLMVNALVSGSSSSGSSPGRGHCAVWAGRYTALTVPFFARLIITATTGNTSLFGTKSTRF